MHDIVAVNGIKRRNSSLVFRLKSPPSMFLKSPSYPHIQPILAKLVFNFSQPHGSKKWPSKYQSSHHKGITMFHTRSSRALSCRRGCRARTRCSRSICGLCSSGCFRRLLRRLLSRSCSTGGSTKGRNPRWHSSTRPCTWRWCRVGLDQLHIKVLVLGI
jgi:hypothetical protein